MENYKVCAAGDLGQKPAYNFHVLGNTQKEKYEKNSGSLQKE